MLALLWSLVCSRDCDKTGVQDKQPITIKDSKGGRWNIVLVTTADDIPKEATHSWVLGPSKTNRMSREDLTIQELADAWEHALVNHAIGYPGVNLCEKHEKLSGAKMLVFWKIKE